MTAFTARCELLSKRIAALSADVLGKASVKKAEDSRLKKDKSEKTSVNRELITRN